MMNAERQRLAEDEKREKNWKRWGPYLSERQWGTVREDYSEGGAAWDSFPHDHARSRAYRWGEDGLLGITDRQCRLCFSIALWNGRDPILKERPFGLAGPEGNHGEDVKEQWFYLDSSPTHSYMKALYKYPQAEFPYTRLVEENRRRGLSDPELELADTGVFDDQRYFDVFVEYAKDSPDDLLIRVTVANRGPEAAVLHLLPTLWFRNTWSWGRDGDGYFPKPSIEHAGAGAMLATHATLGRYRFAAAPGPFGRAPSMLFTENETNSERLFGAPNASPWVKDAFHQAVVHAHAGAANPDKRGTKAAFVHRVEVPAGESLTFRLRLSSEGEAPSTPFGEAFDQTFERRRSETDEFYDQVLSATLEPEERAVARQGFAGLLWSKQFFHYVVEHWLAGDPAQPAPPASRRHGRNNEWTHLHHRDGVSAGELISGWS